MINRESEPPKGFFMSDEFAKCLAIFAKAGLKCEWKDSEDGKPTLTVSHPSVRCIARFATRNQKWRIKGSINSHTRDRGQGLPELIDWFNSQIT